MSITGTAELITFKVHLGPKPEHEPDHDLKIDVQAVNFWYGAKQVLNDVNFKIYDREVTAFIGPSGCGKTTLLRCLNRSHDENLAARMTGRIFLDGEHINNPSLDPPIVRRRFGWVAQRPNPFAKSIYDNVAYAPQIHGLVHNKSDTDAMVEGCLLRAGLWNELKDRLSDDAMGTSVGQQQRLCIARAIATHPEVLLMDEPASALDPIATAEIERLIDALRDKFTIVIITHNMQQAARVAQRVVVFEVGHIVEVGDAEQVFTAPRHKATQAYLAGQFG
jgi:phosphate transport system ATP-binding protein